MKRNKFRGSSLEDFLEEEGILEEVKAGAWKRTLALQLQNLMQAKSLSKSEMAARMRTSRAAVDRLLDEENPSVTLATLEKAAKAVGKKLRIEFVH